MGDKRWKSALQETFSRRMAEEMTSRQLSANSLARMAQKLGHTITQPTVSRILLGKQDPSLEKIHAISEALGVPAWFLLTESGESEQRIITPPPRPNVVTLGSPYERIFLKKQDKQDEKAKAEKKKR
jgi:transcriptional regulator with XRE-family HTH domain